MLQNSFAIGAHTVGGLASPYVIAEVGSNFNQSLDTARRLVDVAADAGASAVKFQLFRADLLYPNGGEMHEIFRSIELDADWVPILDQHARDRDIQFLASAFDKGSVDVLEAIAIPAHKIASSETTNLGFLHYVAAKCKPMIISMGMCDTVDVEEAVNVCLGAGNQQIALLQCGTMYPLPVELANLRVISATANRFSCPVGLSDHTLGLTAATTAIGLGATVFEKHFTLDRSSAGPDHFYALEPNELKAYVTALREGHQALGSAAKEMLPKERELGRREGLHAARNLAVGEQLTASDIDILRPATGLRARYATSVVGAKLRKNLSKGDPITWDSINF
jgi:sialic acid synthase SpsE